jgi:hypothetical protein
MMIDGDVVQRLRSTQPTFIFAGQYKVEGNELEPLADTALQHIQAEVNAVHDTFVKDIVAGRGRGLTADTAEAVWRRPRDHRAGCDPPRDGRSHVPDDECTGVVRRPRIRP